MKYNFYMSLRTQYENLGDYLIAQATIDILKDIGDITLDIRRVPQKYIDLFEFPNNVKLVKKGFISSILFSKNTKWVYIVKPGGYKTTESLKSMAKLLLTFFYFLICKKIFKIKLIKMPHSYFGKISFLEKIYQNIFDLNIVRDELSFENYNKCNIQSNIIAKDLAIFYINKTSKFLSEEITERNNISISLRYDRLKEEGIISYQIAEFILNAENLDNIFYISQVTFDKELNQKYSLLNQKEHISYDMTNKSLGKIIDVYKSSKYIISNRLHALLLAKINGAIPIALIDIEKDKKIIGSLNLLKISWLNKNDFINNSLEKNIDILRKNNYNDDFYEDLTEKIRKYL